MKSVIASEWKTSSSTQYAILCCGGRIKRVKRTECPVNNDDNAGRLKTEHNKRRIRPGDDVVQGPWRRRPPRRQRRSRHRVRRVVIELFSPNGRIRCTGSKTYVEIERHGGKVFTRILFLFFFLLLFYTDCRPVFFFALNASVRDERFFFSAGRINKMK